MSVLSSAPRDLVDLDRLRLDDPVARAALIAAGRAALAAEGCVIVPGFVGAAGIASLAAEAVALMPLAHRRDVEHGAYANEPGDGRPDDDPRRRRHRFAMHALGADDFAADGPIRRLYEWPDFARLVADLLGEPVLHRVVDPLLSLNVTVLGEGDEHGWHFDSNDFVVSMPLQAPERGGRFQFAPGIRDDADPNFDGVRRVMDGDETSLRTPAMAPGALVVFRGKHALHRVTPVAGTRPRIIALFSFDRRPDMNFSDRSRLNVVGRTTPRPARAA